MKHLSIQKSIQIKGVTAIQNVAASPLSWHDRPEFGNKMHAPPNITYRYYTTQPVPFGILLWVYFEHSMIWLWFS
jgi:hypothetical protein